MQTDDDQAGIALIISLFLIAAAVFLVAYMGIGR
jgi:hypothetical protein